MRVLAAVAAGVLVLAGAACSGSSDDSTTAGDGGTFSMGILEPEHLTPGNSTAYNVVEALFAPLLNISSDNKLVNVAAESVTSPDNTVWTIKIKAGWKFHNGEPVTASSYVDAWNATAYGPSAWNNNGQMADIEGYAALNPKSGTPKTKTLSGLKAVDDTTVQVTLSKPDSQFPYQLTPSMLGFYPMPKAAFTDPAVYDKAPVGNGPFQMDGQWQENVQIAVKRYPDFPGTAAKAGGITFKIYSSLDTAYTDAQGGSVDIVSVPQTKFTQVRNDFPDGLVTFNAVSIDFLGLPLWDKRFSDVRLRQAISLAIDRDTINKSIFGGLYKPATGLTPPTAIGGGTTTCGEYCTFDPAKAKQLLAAAGGWTGKMAIWFPGGVGYEQTFEAIANQLRQNLGIPEVTVQAEPGFAEFFQALTGKKATGPWRGHWGSLYPSMQNELTALFTAPGEGNVATQYTSADVDGLIAKGNAAASPEAGADFYHQADAAIMADFPVVPLFFNPYVFAHGPGVSNVSAGFDEVKTSQVTVNK